MVGWCPCQSIATHRDLELGIARGRMYPGMRRTRDHAMLQLACKELGICGMLQRWEVFIKAKIVWTCYIAEMEHF